MSNSTHRVEVVRVHLEPHPNADSLSIVRIYGYTVCVKTADWIDDDLGAYIVPDSVVPTDRSEFAFLAGHERIRVKRLRGVLSQGLLIHAPSGSKEGDDVAELLGVTRYEPSAELSTRGKSEKPPPGIYPCYDLESWHRYGHLLQEGEPVMVTEKIHGASGRWVWKDGRLWCGSRTEWKREDEKSMWWQAARSCSWLPEWCEIHEGIAVYGEVYGKVQKFRYGIENGVFVRVFDLLRAGQWLGTNEIDDGDALGLVWVPLLFRGAYSRDEIAKYANGPSTVPGAHHIREGCVVKPLTERTDPECGRVAFKIVSDEYLERGK